MRCSTGLDILENAFVLGRRSLFSAACHNRLQTCLRTGVTESMSHQGAFLLDRKDVAKKCHSGERRIKDRLIALWSMISNLTQLPNRLRPRELEQNCMHSSLRGLSIILAGAMLLTHPSSAQNSDWQVLRTVPQGQRIRLALRDGTSHEGKLQSVSENSVTTDKQVVNRDDIQRVWLKRNGHRGKHAVIGAGIGAGVGLGTGAAIDADCSKNAFICTGPYGKVVLTPAFGVIGAGIGALLPAHGGWQELYRVD